MPRLWIQPTWHGKSAFVPAILPSSPPWARPTISSAAFMRIALFEVSGSYLRFVCNFDFPLASFDADTSDLANLPDAIPYTSGKDLDFIESFSAKMATSSWASMRHTSRTLSICLSGLVRWPSVQATGSVRLIPASVFLPQTWDTCTTRCLAPT